MLAFIDETGDHNLTKIDLQYPIFVFGALIISEGEYQKMNSALTLLKRKYFNDDGTFLLHSSELKRPYDKRSHPRNVSMADAVTRMSFYTEFDKVILTEIDFGIVACIVDKPTLVSKYFYPVDPYYFAFENLLNRIMRYGNAMTILTAEARGAELNAELLSEYERLAKVGTKFYSGNHVDDRTKLVLTKKSENVSGLQVIDLILASLARAELGKEYKMVGNDLDPQSIRKKLACPITRFPAKK